MFRHRQKSTTGCLACKTRRRKCNEAKPCCSDCKRIGLRCSYPTAEKSRQDNSDEPTTSFDARVVPHQISRIAAMRSPGIKGAANGYQAFSSQMEFDLTMATPFLIQSTINQPCGPQLRDFSCLTTAVLWLPWLRPTFYTYAATMLSVKTEGDDWLVLEHYHKSIDDLRLRLLTGIGTDELFSVIMCTNILGNVEVHGFARPCFALAHYVACAQLLQMVPPEKIFNAEKTVRSFYRTVAEACLYIIASLSLFHPAPKDLLALMDWNLLSQILESPHHQSRRPLQLQSQFPAKLSSFNNLNRVLLVLIVMSREQNCSERNHNLLRLIDRELDVLESQIPLWYGTDVREDVVRTFSFRWRAVIRALHILVEKLSRPLTCSATPVVRHNLQLCILNIVEYNTCLRSRPEMAWPPPFSNHGLGSNRNITIHWLFLVIVAAAHTLEDVNFALPFLERPKVWGHLTHFNQIQNFIDAVQVFHNQSENLICDGACKASCHQPHDGLDMLVSIDGPFSSFHEQLQI